MLLGCDAQLLVQIIRKSYMLQELIRLTQNKLNHINSLIASAEQIGDINAIISLQNEKNEVENTLQQLLTLQG